MIDILQSGPFTTIQDLGRTDGLDQGFGVAGAMDRAALAAANALVGNAMDAPAIETAGARISFGVSQETAISVTGAPAYVEVDDLLIPNYWAEIVLPGQTVTVTPTVRGVWTYVGVAGTIDVPRFLGSCSTDVKNRVGGHRNGQPLSAGDKISLQGPNADWLHALSRVAGYGLVPDGEAFDVGAQREIRVLPAREHSLFDAESQSHIWSADWTIAAGSNRQGYNLDGPTLALEEPHSLLSYGLIPGTIQVPPAGRPIVQMAEANTCGGYPKIGVVIGADLGRLAQARPGSKIRFRRVDRAEALRARRENESWLAKIRLDQGEVLKCA